MSNRTQIGPAVNADLWREFREDVRARKGQVRGVLGDELENAIREYLHGTSEVEKGIDEKLNRLESHVDSRLARVEAEVGIATADGGVDTYDSGEHTHAPTPEPPSEKPEPNAPTEKKLDWLAEELLEQEVPKTRELTQITRSRIIDLVKDAYGFRSDTAQRYVGELIERFELQEHPVVDGDVLVAPDEYERIVTEQREKRAGEAEDEVETKL